MKKILNQLIVLVTVMMLIPVFSNLTAQNTTSNTGAYLQEIKKEIVIPGEKEPDIIRLFKSENTIVAVSKEKIFRHNGKNWNTEKLDFQCNTANIDSKGNIWLAGQDFVFSLTEKKKMVLPAEAKNDTLLCLFLENEKTLVAGTTKGLWSWNGSWVKITETDGIRINQIANGEGNDLWLATSNGIFQRNENKWINLNDYVMDAGLLRNFFSIASGKNPGDVILKLLK